LEHPLDGNVRPVSPTVRSHGPIYHDTAAIRQEVARSTSDGHKGVYAGSLRVEVVGDGPLHLERRHPHDYIA
jgi:hypothetical protein